MTIRLVGILALLALPLSLGGCAGGMAMAPAIVGAVVPGAAAPAAAIATTGAIKATQAARPISDSEEYYVGRAVAARILAKYPLSTNARLTQYVNEVGHAVARKSARPQTYRGYHFAVVETQEVNAFACPGGIIIITRGMVETCANEEQLAAVLAHEVAHIANKDGINSISQARWTEVLTAMGTEAARQYGGVAGNLVSLFEGSIDDVFKTIVVNGYSRAAEEAADKGALSALPRAGYAPQALTAVLGKMAEKEKGGAGGIFKTHPPSSERLSRVQAEAAAAPAARDQDKRAKRFKAQAG
jgi:predicted Zn-dependent protease